MTSDCAADPLDEALGRLGSPVPRAAHAERVRRRCHAVLGGRRGQRERPRAFRPVDLLVVGVVALYVVTSVGAALHLLEP